MKVAFNRINTINNFYDLEMAHKTNSIGNENKVRAVVYNLNNL